MSQETTQGLPIYCETCGEITRYEMRITTYDADYCNDRCFKRAQRNGREGK